MTTARPISSSASVLPSGPPARGDIAERTDRLRLDAANARIAGNWEKIGQAIRKVTLPAEFLSQVLANAGAPRQPQELGWPKSFYATAVKRARESAIATPSWTWQRIRKSWIRSCLR